MTVIRHFTNVDFTEEICFYNLFTNCVKKLNCNIMLVLTYSCCVKLTYTFQLCINFLIMLNTSLVRIHRPGNVSSVLTCKMRAIVVQRRLASHCDNSGRLFLTFHGGSPTERKGGKV